jgi:uncharacterized protein (DUF924 family)
MSIATQQQVISFWFEELTPSDWWKKDPSLDSTIRKRFDATLTAAAMGELWEWRQTDEGRLAEIIVLDQFSRNIFREHAQAYAADNMALVLAQEAVANQSDQRLTAQQATFIYMPYMHSESRVIHAEAERLFNRPELVDNFEFELKHKAIIDRFGRYPHRNNLLGRVSTEEELAFLASDENSSF